MLTRQERESDHTEDGIGNDEGELVRRAIARDREAFAALYERHVSRVYRHLYHMVGHEAEDLTAETFLRAWKAIDRYEIRGVPFAYWLMRIAHNQGISYFRSLRKTRPLPETLADNSITSDPEAVTERRLAWANVKEAISNLRGVQRQVLSLRLMENEDYQTVAALVDRNVPAVRVIQHRGLRKIRNLLPAAA